MTDEKSKQAIVGAGHYVVLEQGTAEVAFGVVDEYRGQAIGGALVRNLSSIARQLGLHKLIAEVLIGDSATLSIRKERPADEYDARGLRYSRHIDVRATIQRAINAICARPGPRRIPYSLWSVPVRANTSSDWWQEPDRR